MLGDLFRWEEGASAPVGCYGHTAVWLNGLVYVGGGNEVEQASHKISVYNPVKNLWSSSIIAPYCYFTMTTLNNKLVTAGGVDNNNHKSKKVFTVDGNYFKKCTKMTKARTHATAAGHQGMLIITGGKDDKDKVLSSTELFNSKNGQWYTCNDLPRPHFWLQSVKIDNNLYLLGGVDQDSTSPAVFTAPLDTLSRHQLEWNTYQDTPWRRSSPVSVHGTDLLILGGAKKIEDKHRRTSEVYKLNKVTHGWEAIGHIPSARESSAAVCTTDNRVIVVGGRSDERQITNTVWIGSCDPQQ